MDAAPVGQLCPAKRRHAGGNGDLVAPEPDAPATSGPQADVLEPSRLLQRYTEESITVTPHLGSAFMSEQEWQEARGQPKLCNLQLKVTAASESELSAFPATLPAADAVRLSPVLKTWLRDWDAPALPSGLIQLELRLGIKQQVLDSVVSAVYTNQLPVGPSTVESLALLAEYLQIAGLAAAVRSYLEDGCTDEWPLEVCKLALAHPLLNAIGGKYGYELINCAIVGLLRRWRLPALVDLATLAPECHEKLFACLTYSWTGAHCLELLLQLRRTGVHLSEPVATTVVEWFPELAPALAGSLDVEEQPGDVERLWAQLAMQHAPLQDVSRVSEKMTCQVGKERLVWAVPLGRLQAPGSCEEAPYPLRLTASYDDFSLCVTASRAATGGPLLLTLSRGIRLGSTFGVHQWKQSDTLLVRAMKGVADARGDAARHVASSTEEDIFSTPYYFDGPVVYHTALPEDWTAGEGFTAQEGALLPLIIELQKGPL